MQTRPKSSCEKRAEKAERQVDILRAALQIITRYSSPERLRRESEKQYGLEYAEALEMAYENVRSEAAVALRTVPKRRRVLPPAADAVASAAE